LLRLCAPTGPNQDLAEIVRAVDPRLGSLYNVEHKRGQKP